MSDLLRVARLAIAIGGRDYDVRALRVEGEPASKTRSRVVGRRAMVDRSVAAEGAIAEAFCGVGEFGGNVAVAAIFYRSNHHRIDVDNLLKTVLDGITASGAWADDSYASAVAGAIEFDPAWPRTTIAVLPYVSSLVRGDAALTRTCAGCGARYRPHSPTSPSRYCSRSCRPSRAATCVCTVCGGTTSVPRVARCRRCHLAFRQGGP